MDLWVFSILCCFVHISEAAKHANLTRIGYSGTIVLFPVPRERVAEKLNEMKELNSCQEGTLNLPNYPILQEFLEPDEHVVGVSIGNVSARSFINTLPTSTAEKYSLDSPTIQFFVPFLTGPDPDDLPHFKMVLSSFVSTDKPFLNPNMAVPATQVDELVISDHGVTMTDGDEYFSVSWEEKEQCNSVNYVISDDVNEYIDELMLPFNYELDFSACAPSDVQDVGLCHAHEEMSCIISRNWGNVCEYWTPLEQFTKCELEWYTLETISAGFQALSLLSEENTRPIVYEMQHEADFAGNIKVPCMEY